MKSRKNIVGDGEDSSMKITTKLISSILLLLISMTMTVCVSFAWVTLSDSPALSGIKVTFGTNPSIKIAANRTEMIDGVEVNYPDQFMETAVLDTPEALLSPASTADGIHWFIPVYDENGGLLNFVRDEAGNYKNTVEGGYIEMDFWIVSPLDNCYIRICCGDDDEVGTYVVELPQSVKSFTNNSGYHLDDSDTALASSIRIGFLIDESPVETNESMSAYMNSTSYESSFTSLRGNYNDLSSASFQIFEPNGVIHSKHGNSLVQTEEGMKSLLTKQGEYWITRPIGIDNEGNAKFVDIQDRLIVQKESGWKKNPDGSLILEDMYQAYLKQCEEKSKKPSLDEFYKNALGESYLQFVYADELIESTWDLYLGSHINYATKDEVSVIKTTNAIREKAMVVLKKNVPQRIRMFVWIEGQDVDCNSNAASQNVAIRLELAGSTGA